MQLMKYVGIFFYVKIYEWKLFNTFLVKNDLHIVERIWTFYTLSETMNVLVLKWCLFFFIFRDFMRTILGRKLFRTFGYKLNIVSVFGRSLFEICFSFFKNKFGKTDKNSEISRQFTYFQVIVFNLWLVSCGILQGTTKYWESL